jgi:hypothetical protein
MAYRVSKTEHSGPKKGRSFWGRKAEAKHQSSCVRRKHTAKEISIGVADDSEPESKIDEKAIQEKGS